MSDHVSKSECYCASCSGARAAGWFPHKDNCDVEKFARKVLSKERQDSRIRVVESPTQTAKAIDDEILLWTKKKELALLKVEVMKLEAELGPQLIYAPAMDVKEFSR